MAQDEQISTTRTVSADAATIFALICRPDGHVQIDGSGMLISATDTAPVNSVGDTFRIHMDRRPLGDIPNMAEYDVTVIITGFEPDALLSWTLVGPDGQPYGHVYGYRLVAIDKVSTQVTSFFDWSGIPEEVKGPNWPVVPLSMMAASLDNLERIVTV
jgi:hypothetical protein